MNIVFVVIGLVAIIAVVWYFTRRPQTAPVGLSPTYKGPIDQYGGGKTLLVATHAPWAPVWRATAEALTKADPAVYDITLIDADRQTQAVRDLGVEIIPTVIVYKDGREVGRYPNLISLDRLA